MGKANNRCLSVLTSLFCEVEKNPHKNVAISNVQKQTGLSMEYIEGVCEAMLYFDYLVCTDDGCLKFDETVCVC